jgi:PhnB protein
LTDTKRRVDMEFVPYLNFSGSCKEAFTFYHQVLGGELTQMITHEDMGIPGLDERTKSLILHARLEVGEQRLMGSDVTDDVSSPPSPVQVALQVDTAEEAERIFSALADGGTIIIPIAEQQWAVRFGFLADRYGIPWMINCEQEA